MPHRHRQRGRDAAGLFAWALVLTPLTILLHELGHFAFAAWSGLPAQLHPTYVSGGAVLGSGAPRWLVALQAGGGPAMTVAMILAGTRLARRGKPAWALAFTLAAASRFFVTTGYLLVRLGLLAVGRPFGGNPNFDEYKLAEALAIRPEITAIAATAVLAATIAWVLGRLPRGRRTIGALALAAGIVAGNLLWAAAMPGTFASVN